MKDMVVLYAEDDVDDFYFLCEVIKGINPNVKCINTRNGFETIEYLDSALLLPEMIVLDINMPAMDGKACLKNIRKDPRLKDIPVIVYTTTINSRDEQHCLQLGALECIEKPNNIADAHQRFLKYFG
jgi:CheY-like chemotaxis protein